MYVNNISESSKFLSLPSEIRVKIYEYVLPNYIDSRQVSKAPWNGYDTRLLRINKQIHNEALSALYRHIILSNKETDKMWIYSLTPASIQCIKKLWIYYIDDNMLDIISIIASYNRYIKSILINILVTSRMLSYSSTLNHKVIVELEAIEMNVVPIMSRIATLPSLRSVTINHYRNLSIIPERIILDSMNNSRYSSDSKWIYTRLDSDVIKFDYIKN